MTKLFFFLLLNIFFGQQRWIKGCTKIPT